jgi:hypothetical protein
MSTEIIGLRLTGLKPFDIKAGEDGNSLNLKIVINHQYRIQVSITGLSPK